LQKSPLKTEHMLIAVPPIVLTELDGNTYINSTNQIDLGVQGSLAVYKDDNQAITHTGTELMWNQETLCLTAGNINTGNIQASDGTFTSLATNSINTAHAHVEKMLTTEIIESDILKNSDYLSSKKVAVGDWLAFVDKDDNYQFNIGIGAGCGEYPEEILCFDDKNHSMKLGFDTNRLYLCNTINIFEHRTIDDPVGCKNDKKRDICVDGSYFYQCIDDYDGESKIWKRIAFEGW
jgi:hypothetical protein